MPTIEWNFETERAQRYLGQLCKHFAHKVPVTYAPDYSEGEVRFLIEGVDFGVSKLTAQEGLLSVRAEAAEEAGITRMQKVLEDHIQQFAWREKPEIVWRHL